MNIFKISIVLFVLTLGTSGWSRFTSPETESVEEGSKYSYIMAVLNGTDLPSESRAMASVGAPAKSPVAEEPQGFMAKARSQWNSWKQRFFAKKEDSKVAEKVQSKLASVQVAQTQESVPTMNPVVQAQLKELPSYQSKELGNLTREFQNKLGQVKAQKTFKVAKPAVAADPSLLTTKNGVPVFGFKRIKRLKNGKKKVTYVKNIPRLGVGHEAEVFREDFALELPQIFLSQYEKLKSLKSPKLTSKREVLAMVKKPYRKALKPKKLARIRLSLPEDVTFQKVQSIQYILAKNFEIQEKAFTPLKPYEYDFLGGLILTEYQKKCHLGIGLLQKVSADIKGEEDRLRQVEVAKCLHGMGFYTDSVHMLKNIMLWKHAQYSKEAFKTLLKDLPREYLADVRSSLKKVPQEYIDAEVQDNYNYSIALAEGINKNHNEALKYALKVSAKFKKYPSAQYLAAISEYATGKVSASLKRQEDLLKILDKYEKNAPIASLIKMNFGRTAYKKKQYKKAVESYQFITKENPLWIQALTEQGWMQLLSKDPFGAIGNMYSMHSPYFTHIYKPESHAIRTIGYLNICQYGDAYRSLTKLEKIYKPMLSQIRSFKKATKGNITTYNKLIVDITSNGKVKTQLPKLVSKEIGRHKDFLNVQESINHLLDQYGQYGFIKSLTRKDRGKVTFKMQKTKERIRGFKTKISGIKTVPGNEKFRLEWNEAKNYEDVMLGYYKFQRDLYNKGLKAFSRYQKVSRAKLSKKRNQLKAQAGALLKKRLNQTEKRLKMVLENNEFLRYEVFAGSGESLRFLSAGGKRNKRILASEEPKLGLKQNWDFDGEFWADEIGHYRSKLKNNCSQMLTQNRNVQ